MEKKTAVTKFALGENSLYIYLLAFGQFGDFFDQCAALLSTSSGYKPIFLDSMELVAIEQASIVRI